MPPRRADQGPTCWVRTGLPPSPQPRWKNGQCRPENGSASPARNSSNSWRSDDRFSRARAKKTLSSAHRQNEQRGTAGGGRKSTSGGVKSNVNSSLGLVRWQHRSRRHPADRVGPRFPVAEQISGCIGQVYWESAGGGLLFALQPGRGVEPGSALKLVSQISVSRNGRSRPPNAAWRAHRGLTATVHPRKPGPSPFSVPSRNVGMRA